MKVLSCFLVKKEDTSTTNWKRVITNIFKNCYLSQSVKQLLGGRAISGIAAIICKWLRALKCWYTKRKRWKSDYKRNVLITYTKALKFAGKRITLNSNVTRYVLVITQRVLCARAMRNNFKTSRWRAWHNALKTCCRRNICDRSRTLLVFRGVKQPHC